MKKKVRILAIFFIAVLISFVCGQPVSLVEACVNTFDVDGNLCLIGTPELEGTSDQEIGTPMELWAAVGHGGNGTLAGHITFDTENVIINLDDADNDGIPDMYPWVATAVHIHFADNASDFPLTKKGSPIPGHFEYNISEIDELDYNIDELDLPDYIVEVDPFQSVIEIPVDFGNVGAIHLAIEKAYSAVDEFGDSLPAGAVDMKITYPEAGSYVELTLAEADFLDGVYDGWCVDVDQTIDNNTWYTAHLYSSYEDLTGLEFEHPENFDKVNYLLNKFYAGQEVTPLYEDYCTPVLTCGGVKPPEALTKGDIQRAIWILIDDDLTELGLGPWSQQRVNAILCDVNANGEGFIPSCDEKTVFIAIPDDGNTQLIAAQTQISSLGISCVTAEETAWGDGKHGVNFLDSGNWATYFNYAADCVPLPEG